MNRTKHKILITTSIIIFGFFIYQYPIQKALALRSFENYTKKQGVNDDIISSKEVIKDWKQGGYLIAVTFKNDPDNRYYYHYETWTHRKGENLKFNRLTLNITNLKKSISIDPPYEGKCKYPPIEE